MNIHKKINYRSWVIECLLLNKWSKAKIQASKELMFKKKDLQLWAELYLKNDIKYGKTTYYKKHLINRNRLIILKKLGVNGRNHHIGFGKNVNPHKY